MSVYVHGLTESSVVSVGNGGLLFLFRLSLLPGQRPNGGRAVSLLGTFARPVDAGRRLLAPLATTT